MSLGRSATFVIFSLTTFLVHLLLTIVLRDGDGNPTMAAVAAFFASVSSQLCATNDGRDAYILRIGCWTLSHFEYLSEHRLVRRNTTQRPVQREV